MENNGKSGKFVITILLTIIAIVLIGLSVNFFLFRRHVKKLSEGQFVLIDGVDTYMEYGQVVKNKLIEVDKKLYYVDENGHKVKDRWAIINNDGDYGYFGSLGDLVLDKIRVIDGKEYYFDKEGVLYRDRTEKKIKTIEGVDYIANKNGELRFADEESTTEKAKETENSITASTAVSTKASKETTLSKAEIDSQVAAQIAAQASLQAAAAQSTVATNAPFANAINVSQNMNQVVPDEFGGPGVGLNSNVASQTVNPNSATNAAQTSNEVRITRTEKVVDSVEGDDYECTITLLKPIVSGSSIEETEIINSCIDEIMDVWLEEINVLVSEYDKLPKSVTFTTASLTTTSKSKIAITISGNVKPKSGSSKSIKYRITYDRNEENADIAKVG